MQINGPVCNVCPRMWPVADGGAAKVRWRSNRYGRWGVQ